jgi:hypothetical protein
MPAAASANPDPVNGSVQDGCQRNPAGLLSYTSPEWVDVGGRQSGDPMRDLQGMTTLAHTADEDLPESHSSYDLDFDVVPDPPYAGLLAGSPTANGGQGNGNFAHDADQAKMHVEWETGSVPSFAWPTEGDRIHMWGQWVWDCGHWGQGATAAPSDPQGSLIGTGDYLLPGQIEGPPAAGLRGEQTELHPIQALAVTRAASYRATAPQRETDFFVSNDGTHAYAESRCARMLTPIPALGSFGPDFSACVNDPANNVTDLHGRTFSFLAPAPPRPSPTAQLSYRELPMVTGHGYSGTLTPSAAGLAVTVTDNQPAADNGPAAFGSSYFVGWSAAPTPPPTHLQWTLKAITVFHSLSEPNPSHPTAAGTPGIGVYNLYVDLNGFWNFIGGKGLTGAQDDSWVPGLGAVTDGQTFTVNRTVDFFVPAGAPVRLDVSGRECDLPRIAPCVADAEVADANDHPGEAIDSFPSAAAALGEHTLRSPVPSTTDPNYQLTYSIAEVHGVGNGPTPPGGTGVASSSAGGGLGGGGTVLGASAAGSPGTSGGRGPVGCAGGVSPRSRFLVRPRSARRRLILRGRSTDVGCGASGGRGRIVAVRLAVARRVGRRCRFLRTHGFGPAVACRLTGSVPARGRSRWRLVVHRRLAPGRYVAWASARDAAGNVERSGGGNVLRFTLR